MNDDGKYMHRHRRSTDAGTQRETPCVTCGLCCDGTLFTFAVLKEGEIYDASIREGLDRFHDGSEPCFRLPCGFLEDCRCKVYHLQRPTICGSYECRLLKGYHEGKLSWEATANEIHEIKQMRSRVSSRMQSLLPEGSDRDLTLHEMSEALARLREQHPEKREQIGMVLLEYGAFRVRLKRVFGTQPMRV